jgi:NAD(P)-dependent dehydrogenase (short-subunit alcohol dehydrogenase family)
MATNRNWLITGTSSGFGRRLTERALENGDTVAATVRRPEALDDLRAAYPDRLHVHVLDVTDTAAVRRTVASVAEQLGRVDVVVSNAGYGLVGAGEELTDEQLDHVLATNLVGSVQLVRAVLPVLRAQGGGRIVQVSSEGGQIAYPGFGGYHASKWGVEGFLEAVAQEVAPLGISVTIVEPGPTATGFGAGVVTAPALATYDETPAGETRRALADGAFPLTGDVDRMVEHILAVTEQTPAPLRLVLGSTAYENVKAALTQRLAELEAQREVALSSDVSG